MPRQNRVTPLGELIATPERGLVYGNRGCLHDDLGHIRRSHNGRRWIACRLSFNGRRRAQLMAPGRYTELFFLDEATAFAAGHRPCAECRRKDYRRLTELWRDLHPGPAGADAIDVQLHRERLDSAGARRRLHEVPFAQLPTAAMVLVDKKPNLVRAGELLPWSAGGYGSARPRPLHGTATVITPPSLLALLRSDWTPEVPLMHPSAAE